MYIFRRVALNVSYTLNRHERAAKAASSFHHYAYYTEKSTVSLIRTFRISRLNRDQNFQKVHPLTFRRITETREWTKTNIDISILEKYRKISATLQHTTRWKIDAHTLFEQFRNKPFSAIGNRRARSLNSRQNDESTLFRTGQSPSRNLSNVQTWISKRVPKENDEKTALTRGKKFENRIK